jgi:hypothetical protein
MSTLSISGECLALHLEFPALNTWAFVNSHGPSCWKVYSQAFGFLPGPPLAKVDPLSLAPDLGSTSMSAIVLNAATTSREDAFAFQQIALVVIMMKMAEQVDREIHPENRPVIYATLLAVAQAH